MQIAENVLCIDRRFAGEPCVRESGKHGSEGGGWKSVSVWKAARWPPTLQMRFVGRSFGHNRRVRSPAATIERQEVSVFVGEPYIPLADNG